VSDANDATVQTMIRMPRDLREKVKELAKAKGLNFSNFVRMTLTEAVTGACSSCEGSGRQDRWRGVTMPRPETLPTE